MFLEQSVLLVSRQEAKPNAILLLWYLYVHESESESHSVVSDSLWLRGLYSSWNSLGQNTGVGSLSLLQGIFPTQGLNLGLPHCRRILYQLSHKESKKIILPEKDSLKCLNNPKIMTASEKLVPYMRILKRWHAFKRVFIMFSPGICI